MLRFHFHLRLPSDLEIDEIGLPFASLEEAFMSACDALPDIARDLLREGHDLSRCTYLIAAPRGETLMEVPFSELQRPAANMRIPRAADARMAVRHHVVRAREVSAKAQAVSADARAMLVRCKAAVTDMRSQSRGRRSADRTTRTAD